MKTITVSVPGKFAPAYLWAAYLERRGALERIITPLPYGRVREFGTSAERTVSLTPVGAINAVVQRGAPRAVQPLNQWAVSAGFDAAAARVLGDCDVFNGWTSTALYGIRAAHSRGIPAVLQIASAHIVEQGEILAEEARRFGADEPSTHPAVIRRALDEYAEADILAVPSKFALETFVRRGVPERKLVYAPFGVQPATRAVPERPERTPRILFVGATSLRKGIPYLLAAFGRLSAPAELRLVGTRNGALLRRLGGLPQNVTCAGVRTGDALAAEFAAADIFVLPSVEDGFGLVTTEALAAGLPVVVTDACGSADSVDEGVNGFVVPSRNVDALTERLELLLHDHELRRRMGAAAARVASFTWDDAGDMLMERVYAPLLGSEGTRARAA